MYGVENMAGVLYGIGVGPGDPELMTLKAVRLIREMYIIAAATDAAAACLTRIGCSCCLIL